MSNARRSTWTVLATLAVVGSTFAGATVGADGTPVQAAASAPGSDAVDGTTTTDGPATTSTTVEPTTSTTVAPTTTTAAPTTTVAPAPPPPPPPAPTTAPPPPPPPPPATTAPPPPPAVSGRAPATPQHGARNTACEQYMYDRINGARAAVGRGGLAFDGAIQHVAVAWSDHLGGTQVLAHNPDYASQILAAGRDYRKAGENVGRGYDLGQLFQAFMDSPGHRENIVSSGYSHVTVGCITDAAGQLWVTQNFWG